MQKDYFLNLPKPDADKLPFELKEMILLNGQARLASTMPVGEILKHCLLRSDNSYIENKMSNIIKKNPAFLSESVDRMKQADFRQFVKDMVMGETENIVMSLRNLRQDGQEKEYQQAMLGWAKFGFGTEQKVDISVEVAQKRELVKAISDDYRYSLMAEDAEYDMLDESEQKLQSYMDDTHTMEFQGDEEFLQKEEVPAEKRYPSMNLRKEKKKKSISE